MTVVEKSKRENRLGERGPTVKRPSERRRLAKQEAIVDAASKLFASEGYEETSLADVARAIDLTPKALYYYYESKRDLLDHVIARGFRYFDASALATTRAKWVGLPLEEALLESSLEAVADLVGHGDLLRVSFSESFRGNSGTSARHNRYMVDWVDHVERVINEAKTTRKLKAGSARSLAVMVVDALFGVCVDGVLRPRQELVDPTGAIAPDRKFFQKLTSTLLRGAMA
jgi:AcrR family transcriptional regulator